MAPDDPTIATSEPVVRDEEGGTRFQPQPFGEYLLIDLIGRGGMAEIFRAQKIGAAGFTRDVAIKRVLPALMADKNFTTQFIDEAKLVSTLVHPNIVQIHELGLIEGQYFIAMELVRGRDLGTVLKLLADTGEHMELALAACTTIEMLRGLSYAHKHTDRLGTELKIVHRDVSPSNVLLSFGGEVKVCDFGIAKAAGKQSVTQTGVVKGKIRYLAPECLNIEAVIDARADVFAAGLVLYELLTSRQAIRTSDPMQAMNQILNVPLPPPSEFRHEVSPRLDAVVAKAVAKKVDERFQSADEMMAELAEVAATELSRVGSEELSRFIHAHFSEEIALQKQIEQSQESSLLGLREMLVERRTPTAGTVVREEEDAPAKKRWPLYAAGFVALTLVALGLGFLLRGSVPPVLTVTSTPSGAAVLVDGDASGLRTPVTLKQLEADVPHTVGCSLDGYDDASRMVTLGAGKKEALHFDLVKVEVPVAPTPEPAPTPTAEPVEPPRKAASKGRCRTGTLSVVVAGVPWAFVAIDGGKAVGETPLFKHTVKAGPHKIKIWHPASGKSTTKSVMVKGCKNVPLRVKL